MRPRALLVALLFCGLLAPPALAGDDLLSVPARSLAQHDQCASVEAGRSRCLSVELTTRDGEAATPQNLGTDASPNTTPSGYGPTDLRSAYGLGGLVSGGAGRTIAIVDAFDDPTAESDLAVYRAQYGLPPCTTANGCFKKVNQSGTQGSYPATDTDWAGEIALDVDMASAVCSNCKILLVEATTNATSNLYAAVNTAVSLGATVVSNSYGSDEYAQETGSAASAFDHAGVPIFASAGDTGYGASVPAAYATVVAVGGTRLAPAGDARGWTESAWGSATASAHPQGTGSGCSAYIARPAWQPVVAGCSMRSIADVSAVADPATGVAVYNTTGDAGWIVLGGTSVSSPVVASVWALIGSPASAGASWAYANPSVFNDVTSGTNSSGATCIATLCTAGTGYDGPTGLGTPNGAAIVPAPPAVTTGAATGVSQTAATLTGTVDPNGAATTVSFEYGTTTGYGQSTAGSSLASSAGVTAVSEALSGLTPGTTCHARVVATSANGTSRGSDVTFTTASVGGGTAPPSGGGGGGGGTTTATTTTTTPAAGTVVSPPVVAPGAAAVPLATAATKAPAGLTITGAKRTPSTVRVGGAINPRATGAVTLTYWSVIKGKVVSQRVVGTIAGGRFRAILTVTGRLAKLGKGVVTVTYAGDGGVAAGLAQQGVTRPTR